MASEKLRQRAGAAGIQTAPPEEEKSKRGRGSRKTPSRAEQAEILSPKQLRVTIKRGDADVLIVVPTEFTIGDIVDRRIGDDIEMYARLVIVEAMKLVTDEIEPAQLFEPKYNPYLEVALSRSNVQGVFRELIVKIARVADSGERLTVSDAESLPLKDRLFLSLWFFRRAIVEAAQAKNP